MNFSRTHNLYLHFRFVDPPHGPVLSNSNSAISNASQELAFSKNDANFARNRSSLIEKVIANKLLNAPNTRL